MSQNKSAHLNSAKHTCESVYSLNQLFKKKSYLDSEAVSVLGSARV